MKDEPRDVERTSLTGRQEWHPGELVRVPERQLSAQQLIAGERLPGYVLKNLITDEVVVRHNVTRIGQASPGLGPIQVVQWNHYPAADQDIGEKNEHGEAKTDQTDQVRAIPSREAHPKDRGELHMTAAL